MVKEAYAFREPTARNQRISTLYRYYLQRTKVLFPYDEYHMQCCDSWTDPVGRAISEGPVAIGSLRGKLSLPVQYQHGRGITNVSYGPCHWLFVA